MTNKLYFLKKASMSLEPQTYWSAVRHANHYTIYEQAVIERHVRDMETLSLS